MKTKRYAVLRFENGSVETWTKPGGLKTEVEAELLKLRLMKTTDCPWALRIVEVDA